MDFYPGEGPEEKTPHERLTRLGWLIMHADRYNNKLYYYIKAEQQTKQIQSKIILYNITCKPWSEVYHRIVRTKAPELKFPSDLIFPETEF